MNKKYNYLNSCYMPRVIREALSLYGTREFAGEDHNPIIIEWARELRPYVGIDYTMDETPWCGLFVGICVLRSTFTPPKICVRAKEWLKFGWENNRAEIGNILVFERRGGGHVGFYVGEDETHYHVLGGNQSDAVNIRRFSKDRCIGIRECPWRYIKPAVSQPKLLDDQGVISYNEQ